MRVERNLAVPMRDGAVLRADAYLPDGDGPFPAVVSRTPYDRSVSLIPPAALDPERATEAGFAVMVQDVRGLNDSEGDFRTFESEGPDGYDTIEWAAAQDWCDGAVGMAGRSYPAAAQWRAAIEQPPHLRAICPVVVGSDYYDGWIYQGGAFELGFNLFWLHLMSGGSASGSLRQHFDHLPLTDTPLLDETPLSVLYREWLSHPTYDSYWRGLSIRDSYPRVRVPALNVGGWYDIFLGGTLENYMRVRAEAASEEARAGTRLLIGPWGHGSAYGPYPDHKLSGLEAPVDLAELQLGFFDRHLRGDGASGGDAEPPVRIFVMGENRWREEPDWPPSATLERWFLREDGALSPEGPGDEEPDVYVYDPRDPAPTIGGPTSLPGKLMKPSAGPLDQRPLEGRPDVLVYSSPALEQPLEVTGPLELVLHAASSAPDTDFVAKLCDVDPEGRSRILAEGVLRARYRESFEDPRPLEPDRPYELRIDLVATSNVFLPGHRIRLVLTSSSHPRFDRNANTGRPPGEDGYDSLPEARQRIFHDESRPSHLLLPVAGR